LKINIKFFAYLREIVGKKEIELEVDDHLDVENLLKVLSSKFGEEFSRYIVDDKTGKPRSYLQYLIDGRSASTLHGLKTELHDGSSFAIIPPVGGGQVY
jgi:MoaD family protein